MKIGFIGFGLIGGSIAKSIRKIQPQCEIVAYDVEKGNLEFATEDGTIDSLCSSIDAHFKECNMIFLCAPVSINNEYLEVVQEYIMPFTILTDVGSVKNPIHNKVKELGMEGNFIGGHPMAGSEKTGFKYATDVLLENAYYILTPTDIVDRKLVKDYEQLVSDIGAIPVILDYEEHDEVAAAISHLPHIIASSLVNLVKEEDTKTQVMKMIAAGGFKDITRIASSSPAMWQQICLNNGIQITKILEKYIAYLSNVKTHLEDQNGAYIYEFFDKSREFRNAIPNASLGPIKKVFSVNCELIDEAGGIATIATILASNHISIKNIGIIHNREFEEGVLKIEFYREDALKNAIELLRKYHYTVYERK